MATLQVRSIDDQLYQALGKLAAREQRSISQQVVAPGDQTANGLYTHVVDVDGPGTPIPPDVILTYADDFTF